jgi:hypothetical protein
MMFGHNDNLDLTYSSINLPYCSVALSCLPPSLVEWMTRQSEGSAGEPPPPGCHHVRCVLLNSLFGFFS